MARWMGVGLIALGAATLALLVLSRVLFPQVRALIETLYTSLAGATLAYPSVEIFYSVKFRDVLIFALFAVASGIALLALRRPRGAWIAAGVLALDLVVASAGFNPAADPAWLEFEPPSLAWLRAQEPQEWRLTAVQGPSATLNANIPWLFGLQDIRGYDSIIPRQYVEYMERIQPQTQLLFNRIAPVFPDTLEALDSPWLDRLAVRYVMVETASGIDLAQTSRLSRSIPRRRRGHLREPRRHVSAPPCWTWRAAQTPIPPHRSRRMRAWPVRRACRSRSM